MKRLLVVLGLLIWAPALALAGGAGNIRLARPVEKVAAGETAIYLQALQHNVHPLADAKVSVVAAGPDGTSVTVQAALDPAFGADNVFVAKLPLPVAGQWTLTVKAVHGVFFPELPLKVEVVAKGTKLPDPGPVTPYHDGGAHSHAVESSPPAPADTPAPPPRPTGLSLALAAGGAVAVAGVLGLWAWRRRFPRTR